MSSEMCIHILSTPLNSFRIGFIRCKHSQCPLRMQIQERKAVDIASVRPSETISFSESLRPEYLVSWIEDLPFLIRVLEIRTLIPVLCSHLVRSFKRRYIILFRHDSVVVNENASHHVQPAVAQSLSFIMIPISF